MKEEPEDLRAMALEQQKAATFIKDLVVLATEDARLINGLVLLFDLFARQRHIVQVQDFASNLQTAIYLGTVEHEHAARMFRTGVLKQVDWDEIIGGQSCQ
jgi:hypothetical protein